ncbi:hypothetical protein LUZ60_017261 [Juncus effusus]|nr:hypothetical protein LUZ60_017261 [Juncus effusus]
MTSAVLPSRRDEPRWTEPAAFMKKHPPFNPNPSFPGSNPNPSTPGVGPDGYVTIRMASYSSSELRELKRRLVSELEQVRSLLSRIESSRPGSGFVSTNTNSTRVMKSGLSAAGQKKCGQILNRLMKHKKQMWFNTPVDVAGMNLHDYYQIVKQPMDLGTVKSRLSKGLYQSAEDFASDVRLTFNNALLYNPKGHVVHELAFELLNLFDKLFNPVSESHRSQSAASTPVITTPPVSAPPNVTPPVAKLPKPKARDQNKRAMSYEEKQRLSEGLQNLPEEKMMQVVGIVRKRNLDTTQDGDEIELDIDTMDNETLWELDRFVSNCKKSMWKHRRREGEGETLGVAGSHAANHAPADVAADVAASGDDVVAAPMIDVGSDEPDQPIQDNKGDLGEEEVDIGEEMPAVHYPPVSLEIQKEPVQESSSSGSGSGSSSSSDSDSASSSSSSGSDGSSPAVGSRSKSPPKN